MQNKMPKSDFKVDEIALVLIVAISAIIISFCARNQTSVEDAKEITEIILDNYGIILANNGTIDENKLKEIQHMDYDNFKKYLKVKNDFCIYIEDENGNTILAKGSPKLDNNGIVCRE